MRNPSALDRQFTKTAFVGQRKIHGNNDSTQAGTPIHV